MESRVSLWHKELQDVFNWHNACAYQERIVPICYI